MGKILWGLAVLAAIGAGCQPPAKPVARHPAPVPKATADTIIVRFSLHSDSASDLGTPTGRTATSLPPDSVPPIPVKLGKVLRADIQSQPVLDTAAVHRFFAKHNLAPLLQTVKGKSYDWAMNGFRGADRYRTETVITAVRRHPHHPAAYQLQGLTRTRRRIQSFRGEVVFDSLSVEPMLTAQDKEDIDHWTMLHVVRLDNDFTVKRYAVAGHVWLATARNAPQSAVFAGRLVMELELSRKGRLSIDAPFLHGPSQGGGQQYAGAWTTYQTHQVIPTVWVEDIKGYSSFIYKDLVVGERDVSINPKYARQGWNTLWENDEWWAKSPKASLSL